MQVLSGRSNRDKFYLSARARPFRDIDRWRIIILRQTNGRGCAGDQGIVVELGDPQLPEKSASAPAILTTNWRQTSAIFLFWSTIGQYKLTAVYLALCKRASSYVAESC